MTARSRFTSMSCSNFSGSLTGLSWPVSDSTMFYAMQISKSINFLIIMIRVTLGDAWAPRISAWRCTAPGASRLMHPLAKRVRSLHSRQFRTAQVHTSRKHCLKIPPLDMFFSASSSPKFKELANIKTSAILTSRCRKDTATSRGIPCVGSSTSNSDYKGNTNIPNSFLSFGHFVHLHSVM